MNTTEKQRNQRIIAISGGIILILVAVYFLFSKNSVEFKSDSILSSEGTPPQVASGESTNTTTESGGTTVQKTTSLSSGKRVRILSPNGGEVWQRNKQYLVKWDTNLSSSATARVYLLKTNSIISNPYANPNVTGTEMFVQAIFPKGSAPEGTYTYKVPQSLIAGKYQVLILAGQECSFSFPKPAKVCDYDVSDGLITIK
jgi:hypothetical protein